ncbi:antitermination protein [Proteus terrae]|uniref:antitermination protein Q n=1 Tax=Proteus terrae TaxID=1574161 RepID=UPI000D6911F3|nr:antitermination protein [Proteus terrae]MBG5948865.1 antitermination protein [Proteus terrae]
MRLADLPKYFSPKSIVLSDVRTIKSVDSLSVTDVMTSISLVTRKGRMGIELFLAKHNINNPSEAIESLYQYALTQVYLYKAIDKLTENDKSKVLQIIANYAFQDYARSAASKKACPNCCNGFIEVEVFTTKSYTSKSVKGLERNLKDELKVKPINKTSYREVRETTRVVCPTCKGKAEIRLACRCHGRGQILDKKESEKQGIPVFKPCNQCSGRGYPRLKFSEVLEQVQAVVSVSKTVAYSNYKPLFEHLVEECFKEESLSEKILQEVTVK